MPPGTNGVMSQPSRVDETVPEIYRILGLAGMTALVAGLVMWFYNVFSLAGGDATEPRFNRSILWLWFIVGPMLILIHALRDRSLFYRRLYGCLGTTVVAAGALGLAYVLVAEGLRLVWVTNEQGDALNALVNSARLWGLVAALVVGAVLVALWNASFVGGEEGGVTPINFIPKWLGSLASDSLVQKTTVGGFACAIVLSLVLYFLHLPLREYLIKTTRVPADSVLPFSLIPMSIVTAFVGLLLVNLFVASEPERCWQRAPSYVIGGVAALASIAGFSTLLTDHFGYADLVVPYGFTLALFGFVMMWAFLSQLDDSSDLGYAVSWVIRICGAAVFVYAAWRSLYPTIAEEFFEQYDLPSYLVPNGFIHMSLGLAFVVLGWTLASENKIVLIMRRELAAYFYSPIAYIIIGGVALIAWVTYGLWLEYFIARPGSFGAPEPIVQYFLFGIYPVFALAATVPMLTMRLLSEEQRSGTMEVLLTAPVDEAAIVVAKFLASWIVFMVAWSIFIIIPIITRMHSTEPFDYRPMLSFYLNFGCMAAAFLSLGIFCSSLTQNQIIAFLLGLGGMMLFMMPAFILWRDMGQGANSATYNEFLRYVSFLQHWVESAEGKVHPKYVLFYLSLTVFWLFLTVKVLESRRWR
jgi:ABC-type transport system involved in multi-copper enzyme maturation permease subunit